MRISSITKNAGKACNNRLYRHIRTFEKIVKNYFVILQYINKEKKTTILLTSHDLKDMEWLCRRLIILEKGEILFDDEITKIFDNYPEAETLEEIIIELFNGNTKK